MELVPVDSSNLDAVGYDESTQTLTVRFKNGSMYEYLDVPPGVFEALVASASKGSFFNQQIKGVYRFARV